MFDVSSRVPATPWRWLAVCAALSLTTGCLGDDGQVSAPSVSSNFAAQTRTYFIAADEVQWDYAPSGINQITGQPFDEAANVFVANGPDRIGKRYIKALYREYTDGTFGHLKPGPAHLGTLGPVIRGVVGDTIVVRFKNNTQFPVSIHPHGVFYDKANEGAPYADGSNAAAMRDDGVPPGEMYTYRWAVPERAGPGPADGSSVFWMYHSHTDEVADTYSGLMGPLVITAAGRARADGTPNDVDVELFNMFLVSDENQSHYLQRNIDTFAGDPASVDPESDEFIESNLMHSINGYVFGNLPGLTMRKGQRVRWNLMGMGTEVDLHTPHWHGNTVLVHGARQDVVELLPATLLVADMKPDDVGTWLYHCHVGDHILAGMQATYTVSP
jgi:FtsP/CotA-like multicopper oxidase with cupredoxin domain